MRIAIALVAVLLFLAPGMPAAAAPSGALTVGGLRWDGRENPLGLIQFEPRLRWVVSARPGSARGQKQTAWQVLVASQPGRLAPGRADLWDSGKVLSAESINVRYGGPAPETRQRLYWTVRVWDLQDRTSPFSPPAWAEMALFDEEWEGQWIGRPRGDWPGAAAQATAGGDRTVTELRRAFSVTAPVSRARVYASAFGVYELRINGQRVSEQVLAPGYTAYQKRVAFQTHDVTDFIRPADNVIEARVAGGWCTARLGGAAGACGEEAPRIMVQLELTAPDGQRQTVVSDSSWQARSGPWLSADLVDGETYDARLERPARRREESGWSPAEIYDRKKERDLVPDPGPPLEVGEELRPVASSEPRPGVVRLDFGKVLLGWVRLESRAAAGASIEVRYLDAVPESAAPTPVDAGPVDRYIARGGSQRWEPRFSLKRFRFVEVQGLGGAGGRLPAGAVVARRVHSGLESRAGLETSDRQLNSLLDAIDDAQRATFASVPLTGGPGQRPGSLLEARAAAGSACLQRDLQGFYRKWIDDIRDAQLPHGGYPEMAPALGQSRDGGWTGAAGVLVPAALDRCYADRTALDAHFPSMGRWLEQVRASNPELLWTKALGAAQGDPGERGPTSSPSFLASAELAHSAAALAGMIRPAGPAARSEWQRFDELAARSRAAFRRRYLSGDGRLAATTPAELALALAHGLVPEEHQSRVGQQLLESVERTPGCPLAGALAGAHLLPALSRIGRDDVALGLIVGGRCPVDRLAAPAALGGWLLENVGGIALDAAAPAGRQVLVRPRPGPGPSFARARHDSLYGPVRTEWRQSGDTFRLRVEVPPNSRARVVFPLAGRVTESGSPIERAAGVTVLTGEREPTVAVGSGSYDFLVRRPPAPLASDSVQRR